MQPWKRRTRKACRAATRFGLVLLLPFALVLAVLLYVAYWIGTLDDDNDTAL